MHFSELSADEFGRIVEENFREQTAFLQTEEQYMQRNLLGQSPRAFAVTTDDEGVLVAGLTFATGNRLKVLNIIGAPLFRATDNLDCDTCKALKYWLNGIKQYAKKHKFALIRCNPNVVLNYRTSEGELDDSRSTFGREVVDLFSATGWNWLGETTGSEGQPRWNFVKDLKNEDGEMMTEQEVFASYRSTMRNRVKKATKNGVTLRKLTANDLDGFKEITKLTGKRRGFADHAIDYYNAVLKSYSDMAEFMLAEVNLSTYIETVHDEIKDAENEVLRYSERQKAGNRFGDKANVINKRNKGRLLEASNQLDAAKQHLKEAQNWIDANGTGTINVACALFVHTSNEMVYLFSGMKNEFRNLYAPYLLQDYAIKKCLELGIEKYNFYGIDGVFNEKSPEHGILTFKQGFGGRIEELVGGFEYVTDKLKYTVFSIVSALKSRGSNG
ncbi:MAG: aminoacyltransferase [Bifidobacteriaceae bacterium]|jgi:alanine adding enzyme|nr:aminoacyltransferase [Bifidobacteriaceae bacterium]